MPFGSEATGVGGEVIDSPDGPEAKRGQKAKE